MNPEQVQNAIIESTSLDMGERNLLTVWLHLSYGNACQAFGGYCLYLPKDFKHSTVKGDFAGHFIFRCLQIAGVESWDQIKGKTIRVISIDRKIIAIGHIINDDWFNPSEDFERMKIE